MREIYLRRQVFLPQDSILFDDTIRFNIALGAQPDREVIDEGIENAYWLANFHDHIAALPHGYDTRRGSNGPEIVFHNRPRTNASPTSASP